MARTARNSRRVGRQGNPGIWDDLKELAGYPVGKRSRMTETDAEELSQEFHGREPRLKIEIAERQKYFDKLAVLGELEELGILQADTKHILPIRFKPGRLIGTSTGNDAKTVWACAANTHQIEFVDGDQELDFDLDICRRLGMDESELEKQYVAVGPVVSIVYYTDKCHLEGPRYQEKGTSYEHKFGEEGGKLPDLFYDTLNSQLLLVGGSYTITPEGIKD